MVNAPQIALRASATFDIGQLKSFGSGLLIVAVCAFLIAFALSLPGRAPDGVILGVGSTLASMLATAQPGRWLGPAGLYAATAVGCWAVMPRGDPLGVRRLRRGGGWLRLGATWMAVPVAVAAIIAPGHLLSLAATMVVFAVVTNAARHQSRDLTIGYAAGLLVCLAALTASGYGQHIGAGAVLSYPVDSTGLIGLGCAARIGLDSRFLVWQRVAALGVGAVTLVAVGSVGVFIAAGIGCVTYLICRLRPVPGGHRVRRDPEVRSDELSRQPLRAGGWSYSGVPVAIGFRWWRRRPVSVSRIGIARALGAGLPLAVLAGLWVASDTAGPRSGFAAVTLRPGKGVVDWIDLVGLIVGAALIVWRVTGPGLPVWVTVVGLIGVAGVLVDPNALPSPGWVLALGGELWVFCHGLRTDRRVIPAPRIMQES